MLMDAAGDLRSKFEWHFCGWKNSNDTPDPISNQSVNQRSRGFLISQFLRGKRVSSRSSVAKQDIEDKRFTGTRQ